jgi:hypothetical protein
MDAIIARTEALPLFVGFSRQADDAMDELQETAFAILTSLLFASTKNNYVSQGIMPFVPKMLEAVKYFMTTAPYKCERPSVENMSEFLYKLVSLDDNSRVWIFENML